MRLCQSLCRVLRFQRTSCCLSLSVLIEYADFSERIRYESTEEYQNWLSQQQQQDDFNYQEEMRLLALENENWIKRECIAQEKWKNQQRKIAKAQLEKHQQTLRIKMVIMTNN